MEATFRHDQHDHSFWLGSNQTNKHIDFPQFVDFFYLHRFVDVMTMFVLSFQNNSNVSFEHELGFPLIKMNIKNLLKLLRMDPLHSI